RGRVLIGGNVTGINFQSLRGVPLSSIVFDFTHQDTPPAPLLGQPEFENDIFEVRPTIDVNVAVASVFLTYGLLDRVDVGVAVPFVRTSLTGSGLAALRLFGVSDSSPHFFADSANVPLSERRQNASSATEGSATGIGDIAARLKFNLKQSERGGFAVLIDARFPTGNEDDFLGSGEFAARGLGIASAQWGDFSPHANVGYLYRSGDLQSDAIIATVGFDELVAPWATLAIDVITQWQVGESSLTLPGATTIDTPFVRTVPTSNIPDKRDHLIDASLGAKFASGRSFTFVANAIFPLRKSGVQADVVFTAGLEYNF
ncbi:MAG: transporter, partial [Gemmatimonadales bacterium]